MMDLQKRRIEKDLLEGHTITKISAFQKYGCLNLGARINELRNAGWDIITEMCKNDAGTRYAKYMMPKMCGPAA